MLSEHMDRLRENKPRVPAAKTAAEQPELHAVTERYIKRLRRLVKEAETALDDINRTALVEVLCDLEAGLEPYEKVVFGV